MAVGLAVAGWTYWVGFSINLGGTVSLVDGTSGVATTKATSSALASGQWHRLEVSYNPTTRALEGRVNGTSLWSGTASASRTTMVTLGISVGLSTVAGGLVLFDDIAVNDSTGSYQNSWPGEGKIICPRPNAAGDAYSWQKTTGGAGTNTNYQLVDEAPPNDATDLARANTAVQDFHNCTDSGIGAADIVNVVQVGCRYDGSAASANSGFKLEIKKTSGGTVTQSNEIIPANTTWQTNAASAPKLPPITLYLDPDGSLWTQATLDTMQIGYVISTANTNYARISAIWAMVDYTPATLKSVTDSGHGSDSVSGIAVALGITDTGSGSDTIPSGTPQATIPAIPDTGSGADSVSAIAVEIALTDTGSGSDIPAILVTVPLTDSGAGVDLVNVMTGILIAVADSGHGTDTVSSITVQVPVSDTGQGTDIVAAIEAVLSHTGHRPGHGSGHPHRNGATHTAGNRSHSRQAPPAVTFKAAARSDLYRPLAGRIVQKQHPRHNLHLQKAGNRFFNELREAAWTSRTGSTGSRNG